MYQEAEHIERASPEDVTPKLSHMVTQDAVVYLHHITYDTTPAATRHRHPIYSHASQLSKHPQMNREFHSASEP